MEVYEKSLKLTADQNPESRVVSNSHSQNDQKNILEFNPKYLFEDRYVYVDAQINTDPTVRNEIQTTVGETVYIPF